MMFGHQFLLVGFSMFHHGKSDTPPEMQLRWASHWLTIYLSTDADAGPGLLDDPKMSSSGSRLQDPPSLPTACTSRLSPQSQGFPRCVPLSFSLSLSLRPGTTSAYLPASQDVDDVFYLFLQKQKTGAELHIYLEEGTEFRYWVSGPHTVQYRTLFLITMHKT